MPNLYVSLSSFKGDFGGLSGVSDDAAYLRLLERVSRSIDDYTGRRFYAQAATRVYDGSGTRSLMLPDDLINASSIKVDDSGDGVYELTLAANTDYWLWPDNRVDEPAYRLDLNPEGTQIGAWPRGRRRVQIVGSFGYSNESQAAGTLGSAISDTAGTTVTMAAGHSVEAGDTIIIDSEQMHVSAVATNALTVTRGLNGSAAATHANAAAVSRRRYPRAIEEAALMQATRWWRDAQAGFSGALGEQAFGGFSFSNLYPAIRDLLAPYRLMVVS